jgi:hypothetical protein
VQQPLIVGAALAEPSHPDDAPVADQESASERRLPGGPARAPRHDRRDTLRSLAAELSAAAARVDDGEADDLPDIRLPQAPSLTLQAVLAEVRAEPEDDAADFAGLRLTAISRTPAPEATEMPAVEVSASALPAMPVLLPADGGEDALAIARLEKARAEAEVLAAKYEAEAAARADAERRLAEAKAELDFLRAEIQMAGQKRRKPAGRVRRLIALLTGRRRKVLPANQPKGR